MITVTRLDKRVVVINADLIKMLESTPDTIITLVNGDTLIVTTSHIDFPYVDDEGTPLSADAVITERFTVSNDGNQLLHELTVTDPANFVEPAVVAGSWSWVPGIEVGLFECEPE